MRVWFVTLDHNIKVGGDDCGGDGGDGGGGVNGCCGCSCGKAGSAVEVSQ